MAGTMKLDRVLRMVDHAAVHGPVHREVAGIAYDSRLVQPGWLFACLRGQTQDGRRYIPSALERGASVILSEPPQERVGSATQVLVSDARLGLAQAAAAFYDDPSAKLEAVGITGTSGKTTLSYLVRDILKADGRNPGLLGTIRYEIGARGIPASRTTPEASDLQAMLAEMAAVGCRSAVMEVSSHALVQNRVWGVAFDAAVFLNLSPEHLDFHGTMEAYFAAKCRLFEDLALWNSEAVGVVNADDPWGQRLLRRPDIEARRISYGVTAPADVRAEDIRVDREGSRFRFLSPWGKMEEVRVSLLGRFNAGNALAAMAVGGALGVAPEVMAKAVEECRCVPGRLERIPTKRGFEVFVDYAHKPEALRTVLGAVRGMAPMRILLVFGCGGDRDASKRPAMGAIAARQADYTIVTSDNPRREDPREIVAQIEAGFAGHANHETIVERGPAIRRALELARPGDTVLIAGKGHETYQEFADRIVPFDDRQAIREWLQAN